LVYDRKKTRCQAYLGRFFVINKTIECHDENRSLTFAPFSSENNFEQINRLSINKKYYKGPLTFAIA